MLLVWRLLLLVGDGLEGQLSEELVDVSSRHDQFSVTMVRSSQLCEICSWLCRPRSWLTSRVVKLSAHSSLRSWDTSGVRRGPPEAVAGDGLAAPALLWWWGDEEEEEDADGWVRPARGLKLPEE